MKKFLKKLGVIGLIVAVLSPFLTLPDVNAETNCKKYLNQYLFLDASGVGSWQVYANKGYTTHTSYLYNIPASKENETIIIEEVGEYPLTTTTDFNTFHGLVKQITRGGSKLVDAEKDGDILEQEFTTGKYETVTALLHGEWAREDGIEENAGWQIETDPNVFLNKTIQQRLKDKGFNNVSLNISVGGAIHYGTSNTFSGAGNYTGNIIDFYQKIVNDLNENKADSYNEGYIYKNNKNEIYMNFTITRTMDGIDLKKIKIGGKSDQNLPYVWSTVNNPDNLTDSITALKNYQEAVKANPNAGAGVLNKCADINKECYQVPVDSEDVMDFNASEVLYWPAVYNIAYSVCQKEATPVEKWTLKYDPNSTESDYTNMPKDEKDLTTNTVVVSSTEPTRTNYKFVGWNTKADRSGTNYKAKDNVEKPKDTNEITLYAQWDKLGPEEPKKQGVLSYVLGFAAVGLVAGGIYLVSKKKNLFKQI